MQRIFVTLMVLMAVSFSAFSQGEIKEGASFILDEEGKLTETTAPIMKFEVESHDFGTVAEGPKIQFDFVFVNEGKEPLILKNVKASCGCTTPQWAKEPIMPGEESVITAVYNTKGRPGPFNKSITITSNAYEPTKRLFIKGKVDKEMVAKPEETQPVKTPSIITEKDN